MPDATGLQMGNKGSIKGALMRGVEAVAKDMKKAPASLEESKSSGDEDRDGGMTGNGKKRKDRRGPADEDRSAVTKRVLRSDAIKLRAEAEAACGVAVEVSCNGEEANGLVGLDVGIVSEELALDRCSEGMPGVPATIFSQGEKVSAVTHSEQNDSRAGINSLSVDEAQDNKVRHGPCGEVIDSAIADDADTTTDLTKFIPASGSESVMLEDIKQDNNVDHIEEVILHSSDPKVEKHSHVDNVCTETEISLTENGRCTVDNHTDLTGCTKQEERGSPVNEANDVSSHDIVFTRRGRKSCEAKQGTCGEESLFEKRVTRSATVRQREVSGSSRKTTTNEAALGSRERKGDIVAHYTRKVSSAVSPKGHHAKLGERNTSMEKQTVKEKVFDRRDSGVTENDNHVNAREIKESENETEINLKTQPPVGSVGIAKKTTGAAVSAVDQNISGSAITERNDMEHTDSDGVKSENKTPVQKSLLSVGAKIVASKKRMSEAGLDKTTGGSPISLPSMKKARNTSSDPEIDQPDKSSGEKLIGDNSDLGNKRVLRERLHHNPTNLSSRSSNHSNQNAIRQTQDQSDDDEISSDTSYRRTRSGRRRGAARLVVPKQEDSSDSEEVVVKKNRRKRKKSVHKQRAGSKLKHTSGPSKAGRLGRPPLIKSESSSLSLQPGKGKMKVPEGTGTPREEKQKISDQIKAMLLAAGWTIDKRPRNGRDYMDSVYIPPSGKGSYWSVTKAYYVFRAMESEQKESSKDQTLSKNSVGSPGKKLVSSSPGCTLTDDILSKLKRVVVNKRTTKVEIQRLRQKRFKKEKKKKTANSRRLHLGNERKKRGGCALLVRGSNKESGSGPDGFVPYEWKRSIFSWLIDLDVLSVNTKLKCMDESHSKVLLEGIVTRNGIDCSCCSEVFSVLEFVAHAGSEVNKPYRNILVDGQDIDLLHCLINAWNMQSDAERQDFFPVSIEGDDPNDDTCGICGDGGNLICCDGCPSTFHMSCLGLEELPSDYWCCANCSCKFCHEHSSDGAEDIADVDSSLHTCSQCEEQYHEACSPENDSITNLSSQTDNVFCQQSCRLLFEELQNLLAVKKDLEPGYSCRVVQRIHEDVPEEVLPLDTRVECNSKIAVALSLMDECFLPIVDQRTGINLIRNVVYSCGSNFARLDFRGFYIFILERGDEIIAAASVRIHGTKLAEMPFIGTRNMYRRQGMCRRLVDGIEMILSSLNVEKLIIPAITELVDTWTSRFGFSPLEDSEKEEMKSISMLVFPGTGLLQKPLLKALPDEDQFSQGDKTEKSPDVTNEDSLCSDASADPLGSGVKEHGDNSKNADGTCNGDVSPQSPHS